MELYETKYDICDHVNTNNPLALVQFNPSEEYIKDQYYEKYLSTFIYRGLGKKLNMTFDQFLDRPRYEIESMLRVISEIDKKQPEITEKILKDLDAKKQQPT